MTRTTRFGRVRRPLRLLATAALAASIVVPALPAVAADAGDPTDYQQVVDLTFPFTADVDVRYRDDYDASRGSSRRHQSTDLMVAGGTPVHAAVGGTVSWISGSRDGGPPSYGWMLRIAGDDGRDYAYVHLGWQERPWGDAYAPGIDRGARVERGALIGWAGCSGSASCGGGEHLHFEIHDRGVVDPYDYHDHERINPYPSLVAAETRGDYARTSYAPGAGGGGPFSDIDESVHRNSIRQLDEAGVAVSCGTGSYCPTEGLRRSEMAVLLTRALDLPPADETFVDVADSHPYAAEIGALAAARITLGCNPPANDRFCPEAIVTRQQMASFLVRALDLEGAAAHPFVDVTSDNVHEANIAALAESRITRGCNPPANDRYCPAQDVTRGQMASFIVRGIDL